MSKVPTQAQFVKSNLIAGVLGVIFLRNCFVLCSKPQSAGLDYLNFSFGE